jgi:hypothetical protein
VGLGILSGIVIGLPICLPKRVLAWILIGFDLIVFLIVLGISLHQSFRLWLCRAFMLFLVFMILKEGLNTPEVLEFYVFLNLVPQFHFVSQVVSEFGRKKL